MWLIDRIDFVDNVPCHFCNRPLKTNIAYILISEEHEVPSGPTCAKKHSKNPSEKIPDFTKASFDVVEEDDEEEGSGKGKSGGGATKTKPIGFFELEYLRLRAEKLSGFKDAMFPKLNEVYQKYKNVGLEENDLRYIENLIKMVNRDKPLFTPKNLQTCYAYAYWIERFLERKGANDFASSVLSQLQQKLKLTESQIVAINKWFKHIDRMPSLNTKAFS